ncbi:MurR/RpiR family transcriptional regulator [Photobacterium piscicola]|uniref:MurR/RpiR family transcriptional regulator n=1 Tax=Photobacterium TaxID=657 RepID=UPI002E17939C|nr:MULTISPECIES: MurR/RpiR family transcriptional regulator [Photobacterium]MEC6796443.1 MurR/RpiR family transcriptional regulator [Photobacterium sp. S4TG1]MEC6823317.1 MurR/RpiR family transcriptional regulator [Photobacterium piscicola]
MSLLNNNFTIKQWLICQSMAADKYKIIILFFTAIDYANSTTSIPIKLMTILANIANIKSQLSPSAQKIAALILQHPKSVVTLSSQQLAQQANVGQSSIVKFTQKLGFKGFPAFKMAMIAELDRQHAIGSDPQQLPNQISYNDTFITLAQKLAHQKTDAIIDTTNAIDEASFQYITALFTQAQRIQLIGLGDAAGIAKDFSTKLLTLGMAVITEQEPSLQIIITRTLQPSDMLCIIGEEIHQPEIIKAAHQATTKGVPLVTLTSHDSSTLRQLTQFTLNTLAAETSMCSHTQKYNYSIALQAAQQTLTDLLFMALAQQSLKNTPPNNH